MSDERPSYGPRLRMERGLSSYLMCTLMHPALTKEQALAACMLALEATESVRAEAASRGIQVTFDNDDHEDIRAMITLYVDDQ